MNEPQILFIRLTFGKLQSKNVVPTQRPSRKGEGHAAVNAPRNSDNNSSPIQLLKHLFPHCFLNLSDRRARLYSQNFLREGHLPCSIFPSSPAANGFGD